MFHSEIQDIRVRQTQLECVKREILARTEGLSKRFSDYFAKRLAEEFPGVQFYWLAGLDGGCLADGWTPNAFVYSVNGLRYSHKSGRWFDRYPFVVHEPPLDRAVLERFLTDVTKVTGVFAVLVDTSEPDVVPDVVDADRPDVNDRDGRLWW